MCFFLPEENTITNKQTTNKQPSCIITSNIEMTDEVSTVYVILHVNSAGLTMTDSHVTWKSDFLAEGVGIYIFLNGSQRGVTHIRK